MKRLRHAHRLPIACQHLDLLRPALIARQNHDTDYTEHKITYTFQPRADLFTVSVRETARVPRFLDRTKTSNISVGTGGICAAHAAHALEKPKTRP